MAYVTRSGRTVKKPELYEPKEICEDDYSDSEEEGEEEDIFTDEESESDEEDADENGNLKGFVVSDDDDDSDEEA
jgi:hypothetical protein